MNGRMASVLTPVLAVATVAIAGLFAAAIASWAVWQTSPPHPDRTETVAVLVPLVSESEANAAEITPAPGLFELDGAAMGWGNAGDLLWNGLHYRLSATGFRLAGPPDSHTVAPSVARDRLAANGWTVDDASGPELLAHRDDLMLTLYPADFRGGLQRTAPGAVTPVAIVAGLAGAALGWLVFAWARRRLAGERRPWDGSVLALSTLTMLLWWPPALLSTMVWTLFKSGAAPPLWEWLGQPAGSLFFLAGCVTGLGALLHAARPRHVATVDA